MKKPHALIGLLAAVGTAIGVLVAVVGLPYGRLNYTAFAGIYHGGTPFVSAQVELDCNTALAGVQDTCTIGTPAGGTRDIAVILSNFSGVTVGLGAFNFDIYNPSCGGTGATTTPSGTPAATGCTTAAAATGIWPASNPLLTGASTGFTNVVNAAGFATGCATGGDNGNVASGATMTSTSFLSCFNSAGGETLADTASVILGVQTYNVDVPAPTTIPLTLSNVAAADDATVGLLSCDPAAAPPAAPTGVTGPCFGATLIFEAATATPIPPTATATNTPLPATATPTPPAGVNQTKTCLENGPHNTYPDPAAVLAGNSNGAGNECNLFICIPDTTPYSTAAPCGGPGEGDLVVIEKVTGVFPGLGAYEFQVEFDSFVIQSVNPRDIVFAPGGASDVQFPPGRIEDCSFIINSENSVRFGCVTTGFPLVQPPGPTGSFDLAKLDLVPAADDVKDLFPGNDNGIPTLIKDNQCELADILGHPLPGSVNGAGQNVGCGDIFVTVRILEGDINLDCKVDVYDEAIIAGHFGAFFGSALYLKWLDLEPRFHDLDIDIKDLQKVFGRDGSTCQNPIPAQTPVPAPFSLLG